MLCRYIFDISSTDTIDDADNEISRNDLVSFIKTFKGPVYTTGQQYTVDALGLRLIIILARPLIACEASDPVTPSELT